MASAYHVRSNSLPSRPNPCILDVAENLQRLSSFEASTSSSALSNSFGVLRDLYDSLETFLQLPQTQQLLIQKTHMGSVDEMLNASLCFLDVCGTAKDVLTQTKECLQQLQSMFRRRRGDRAELVKEAERFLASRKMSKKAISKCLKDLNNNCSLSSFDNTDETALTILRQVAEETTTSFESLLTFIAGPKASSWSLVSKLMHKNSKRVSCEEQASNIGEFQKVDLALQAFIRKNISTDKDHVQDELRKMELSIQDLEDELDALLRRMIRTRAFLLNRLVQ